MMQDDLRERDDLQVFICMSQVWGEEYSFFFAEYVLPSFLSQGNLGEGHSCKYEFHLFTTKQDWKRIDRYPSIRALEGVTNLVVRFIELEKGRNTFDVMNECQEKIAREAQDRDLPAIYLQPDAILSDGCIRSVVAHWRNGIRCFLIPGVRANKESFVPKLYMNRDLSSGVVSLKSAEIVDHLVGNLHEISASLCIDSEFFSSHPSHVYFVDEGKGLAAVCAHVHPLMVHATLRAGFDRSTLDGVYVHNAVSDKRLIHTVYDSGECVVVEISSSKKNFGEYLAQKFDWMNYMAWAIKFTTPTQRYFMLQPYLLKGTSWENGCSVEKRARGFIDHFHEQMKSRFSSWYWRNLLGSSFDKASHVMRMIGNRISRLPYIGTGFRCTVSCYVRLRVFAGKIRNNVRLHISHFKREKWINEYGAQEMHPIYIDSCAVNSEISQVIRKTGNILNFMVLNESLRFNIGNNIKKNESIEVKSFADFNHAKMVLRRGKIFSSYDAVLLIDTDYDLIQFFSEIHAECFEGLRNVILVVSYVNPDLIFSKKRKFRTGDKVISFLESYGSEYLTYIYSPRINDVIWIPGFLYKIEAIKKFAMLCCSCALWGRRFFVEGRQYQVSESGADRRWSYAVCRLQKDQLSAIVSKMNQKI
ncbi:hypothetical protein [Thalassospira xiamenensis]|uniref:Uncharacterized protein n=1 Tax=Thalassospira xiamenensis TaxID=220697 RepID=A0ABR5Y501_9PROT|nr:hypothetical protein [Thalassospira xiamenensis]KZD05702.1 hypothetical protein AUP40_11890 [Thalassospira xiamenensis]KZD09614.1 hypothetical protein AUP45_13070 [Thalassospira xiamenensis]MCD1595233.1 hypothetical protein [Thalassospira xiamenensis]